MNGMLVKITGLDGGVTEYHNVTQVHFGYASPFGHNQIAFESDIHCTGTTNNIGNITELEIVPEEKKASKFQEA
jgi:hypothetical protein